MMTAHCFIDGVPFWSLEDGIYRMRDKIYSAFKGNVFQRALFYNYGGGLRFSLSEGGSYIQQFLTAMQKATLICLDLLACDDSVVCCLLFAC